MTWKVLITAPYFQPVVPQFRQLFEAHEIEPLLPPVRERLSEQELLRWVGDVDAILCGDDELSVRVLGAAPRLKVISKWGTGMDSIDREAAARFGIKVCNTPTLLSDAVADTVLGYVLCFARQLPWMDDDMRAGRWEKRACRALGELTLGVIGVGSIGQAVVRRAVAFGMRVLGHDIVEVSGPFLRETGLRVVGKAELLCGADFISLNCDLNPTSFHLLSDGEFALMKPTATVINTARGPVVDEAALIRALRVGRIAGAALDVFEEEPLPPVSSLRTFPNVLLAPHNANNSARAWARVHEQAVRNLLDGLGLNPSTPHLGQVGRDE